MFMCGLLFITFIPKRIQGHDINLLNYANILAIRVEKVIDYNYDQVFYMHAKF